MPANPAAFPDIYGLGSAGSTTTGGGYADGSIRDLSITESDYSVGGVLTFSWEQDVAGSHYFLAYIDGAPVATVTPGEPWTIPPVGDGDHSLHVVPIRVTDPATPEVPTVTANGDQILLSWEPSSAADVVAYRIYWDSGTGTVDTDDPLATVDLIESPVVFSALPTSGTGSGRLTIDGSYRGAACNADWSVTVEAGAATWTYATQDGASGESIDLLRGVAFNLPGGVRVSFDSPPADYDASDEWAFRVGPRTQYVTPSLDAGTYKFQICSVDAAGNESTLSSEIAVAVSPAPQPPTNIAATWDAGDGDVTLTWTASTTAGATYRVYSDYSDTFDTLQTYIDEVTPIATSSGTSAVVAIATPPESLVHFYVRAVSGGTEESNADMVAVDVRSAPLASLATPSVTAVTPAPGGEVTVAWQQPIGDGVPSYYNVYRSTSTSWGDAILQEDVLHSAAAVSSPSGGAVECRWTSSGYAYAETLAYWGVRPVTAADVEGPQSNLVAATPDSTAPDTPTAFEGVPV